MTATCRVLLLIGLCTGCLAFDTLTERSLPVGQQDFERTLLETETALTAGHAAPKGATDVVGRQQPVFGPDPARLLRLPATGHTLILLRNASKIVLCDPDLKILSSAAAPRGAVALGLIETDIVIAGGDLSGRLQPYRITGNHIQLLPAIDLPGVVSVRDLVVSESGSLFLLDSFAGNLVQVQLPAFGGALPQDRPVATRLLPVGAGPLNIRSAGDHLVVNLMLEHTILVIPLRDGAPRLEEASKIVNAGPLWSIEVSVDAQTLVIAAGGVENRPLSREAGEFGYIDSFLYLFRLPKDQNGRYRWQEGDRENRRRYRAVNLSAYGILTPKALHFTPFGGPRRRLWVTGYGGEQAAEFVVGPNDVSVARLLKVMPGISDALVAPHSGGTGLTYTSALLDRAASVDVDSGEVLNILAFDAARATPAAQLGEMLFFTDLMSPHNSSQGHLSRFTCESCHFEGLVDGRTHFTGRANVFATTKPLHGLANNVPLFSRAGDDTLSAMVMAEFQVANQNRKAFFAIPTDRHPWLPAADTWPETLSPLDLRKALLAYFVHFNPKVNPWRIAHPTLDDRARRGLAVFKDRCADCHQPLVSTRTRQGIDFEQWPDWLTSQDRDLVWGAPFSARTGVRPYVADTGARVPSLRRVWLKRPLFTNGSAGTVREVLSRFRYRNSTVWHHFPDAEAAAGKAPAALTAQEIGDLDRLLRYF